MLELWVLSRTQPLECFKLILSREFLSPAGNPATHAGNSDLLLGVIYYRSQVSLVTGWIHHILYVFIVQVCIKRAWTQIFCLCSLMEVRWRDSRGYFLLANQLYRDIATNLPSGDLKPVPSSAL